MRTFEFSDGASNKFWNIALTGANFSVTFGKIGTAGQKQIKEYDDDATARKEHDKLVAEKLKKGYKETTKTASTPAPVAKPAPVVKDAPAPVKAVAPAPAPVAAPKTAAGMRTFTMSDASSHKFWNIELQGTQFIVVYGRQGTAGTKQEKTFADDAAALKEHDKLIAEKTKKGYKETTPSKPTGPKSLKDSLEESLVENPDDLASHMAYADYLTEQDDPRGDFIRIQLALERPDLKPAERKKLAKQEAELLDKHKREWLGDLAEPILDAKPHPQYAWMVLKAEFTFARGWLHSLKMDHHGVVVNRILAKSPAARLLSQLHLHDELSEEDETFEPGPDVPEDCENPAMFALIGSSVLGNVKTFIVGEVEDEKPGDEGYFNCHSSGEAVAGIVKSMPKLRELHVYANRVNADQLFSLRTLPELRSLILYHSNQCPLGRLAKNPCFQKLEVLRIHPHAIEDEEDGAYIKLAGIRDLVRSPNLPALRYLQLRATDAGDKGVKEIVESGILARLEVLDLRHGLITDKGADLFAKCADARNLQRLDLTHNIITPAAIAALSAAGVKVVSAKQFAPGADHSEIFFAGDCE